MGEVNIDFSMFKKEPSERVMPDIISPFLEKENDISSEPKPRLKWQNSIAQSWSHGQVYQQPRNFHIEQDQYQISVDSGYYVIKDENNCYTYCARRRNGKDSIKLLYKGIITKVNELQAENKEGVSILYEILYKADNFARIEEIYISKEELYGKNVISILAENKICVSNHKGVDTSALIRNYILSKAYKMELFPYSPGWREGKFMVRMKEHKEIQDTPFFKKVLLRDDSISQGKALKILKKQLLEISSDVSRAFINFILHYALLKNVIKEEIRLNEIFVVYGRQSVLEEISYLFFQFYNRNTQIKHYLYDADIVEQMLMCKDEVFVIVDNHPDTDYKRNRALKNFSDIKDIVLRGECGCTCLIISDCGVVEANNEIFHLIINLLEIQRIAGIREALGTHIKNFTEWVENNYNYIASMICEPDEDFQVIKTFLIVFAVLDMYECGNEENFDECLKIKIDDNLYSIVKELTENAYCDYNGDWICECFREAFVKTNMRRISDKAEVDMKSDEAFVYIRKEYVCFREKEIELILKHFPSGMRRIDILKALKKCGYILSDDDKRYEKNVLVKGGPVKMIVANKELLFPTGSVEGAMI